MLIRLFDILLSLIILLIFLPFGIVLSLFILFSSKGSIFYKQKRIGKGGHSFHLLKFRTMRVDADKKGKLTVGMKDPRITKIGYFLRKYKLDEFPQFLNVLLGDMSIVGPRPEVEEYVNFYSKEQKKVLDVRPGITDYASLEYFKENEILAAAEDPEKVYIEEVMPAKIKLNLKYIDRPTLSHYLKLIFLTFKKMVTVN